MSTKLNHWFTLFARGAAPALLAALVVTGALNAQAADLMALYRFNDSSIADVAGSLKLGTFTGQTFDGTVNGTVTLSSDHPANGETGSLSLNGGYIDLPTTLSAVNPFRGSGTIGGAAGGDYTITCWFKTSGGAQVILSSARDATPGNHSMAFFVNGDLRTDNFYVNEQHVGSGLNNDAWHFGVVTYQRSGNVFHVIVDGSDSGAKAFNPAIPNAQNDTIRIGGSMNTTFPSAGTFIGYLSDVAIFQGVLSSTELAKVQTGDFSSYLGTPEPATMLTFGLPGNPAAVIDQNAKTITLTVPPPVTALAPIGTVSSGTCDKDLTGATSYDFTTPQTYTVTDGGTVNTYTVTVNVTGWSYSAWTGDADSGITDTSPYTAAVNFNGDPVTVNGVAFQGSALSGSNFSIGGDAFGWGPGGSPVVTGASQTLANTFIYAGNPRTITLTNLTPGYKYETSLFAFGWEAPGNRLQTFASGGDSRVVDQDFYGLNEGIRIIYTFIAGSSGQQVLTITPDGTGTFHMSALANRLVDTTVPARILTFGLPGNPAVIDQNAKTITLQVPYGPPVTALAPIGTVSSGTCNKDLTGATSYDFTTPQTYTVTDGGTVNTYTVTVNVTGWSYSAWTGDADSGITDTSPYTVAVNFNGDPVTVNGVAFQGSALSGPNFSIGGAVGVWGPGGSPNVTGNSATLANTFIYGGPRTITLTNLTPGYKYETSLFAFGFDAPGNRLLTFASGGDSRVVDQDFYGQNEGIRIIYTFIADSSGQQVLTITPAGANTFHMSALANRLVVPARILTFGLPGNPAVIDQNAKTITLTVPPPVTALAPIGTVSSGSCDKDLTGATSYNFTTPQMYTVTDGGTVNTYTVSVKVVPKVTETDQSSNFAQGSVGYQADVPSTSVNLLADPSTTLTLSGGAPANPPDGGVGTSTSWSTLTDGSWGTTPASGGGGPGEVAIFSDWILTYTFAASHSIPSIDVFSGWGDGGRKDPNVTINYSTDGITFLPLKAVSYSASGNSAWVHLDVEGLTAKAIQFAFGSQQNGYVGYTELAVTVPAGGYASWATTQGLTGTAGDGSNVDPAFAADPNKDGIQNGMAWILGAGAQGDPAANLLKLPAVSRDGTGALVLTFDRLTASEASAPLVVQYGDDLGTTPWTELAVGTSGGADDNITIAVATGGGSTADYDRVTVTIPATYMAAHPKTFARLMANLTE